MKSVFNKLLLLLCALCLLLSLTGCERADYVKAVEVYNTGDFAQAQQMFLALEDYENSAALAKRCQYHLAVDIYRKGDFQNAIPALEVSDWEICRAEAGYRNYTVSTLEMLARQYPGAQLHQLLFYPFIPSLYISAVKDCCLAFCH